MGKLAERLRERLREAEKRYGTQKEMAVRIGVTPETLNRWLNGKPINPRLDTLENIAEELGVSVAELAAGEPSKGITPQDVRTMLRAVSERAGVLASTALAAEIEQMISKVERR